MRLFSEKTNQKLIYLKKCGAFEFLPTLLLFSLILGLIFVISSFKSSSALSEKDTIPPRTPQALEVKTKKSGFDISWRENYEWDIFSYLIYIRTGDEKEDLDPVLVGKTGRYSVENLIDGVTYYVSIAAKDIAGNISPATEEIGITPDSSKTEKDYTVSGWMPVIDVEDSQNSFLGNIDLFDYISPYEHKVEPDGKITKVGEIFSPELKERAKSALVKIIPTITNNYDQDDVASNLLKDEAKTEEHINNIVSEVEVNGFDGIDLDYENLDPSVRDQFTNFISKLSSELHAKGKILSVTVQAKKSDDNTWRGPGALDFEAIGKLVDQFRVMTYDYSRPNTSPGAIAPIDWMREVISYAKSHVPSQKIIVGIPFYGYQWCIAGEGDNCKNDGLVYEGVQNIVSQYNPTVEWNDQTKAPWFLYIDDQKNTKVVNFEDHRSLSAKLELIKTENVGGITIWRLGSEDSENYTVLKGTIGKEINIPKEVKVKPGNHEINVSWQRQQNDKLRGYRIKVQLKENQSFEDGSALLAGTIQSENLNSQNNTLDEKTFDVLDGDSYTIPNLENDQSYYVTLTPLLWNASIEKEQAESQDNAKLIFATPSDLIFPEKISDLKIENVETTTIDLSFSAPGDDYFIGKASRYEIRYSDEPFILESFSKAKIYSYVPNPSPAKEKERWQLRGLTPGVKYYVAIRSFDEKENPSDLSNIVSAETIDNIPPKVPTSLEILSGDKTLYLKWQKNSDRDLAGYNIFWQQGKSYYQEATVGADITTYTLANLENNYDYHIAISAFDDKGNESAKSEEKVAKPEAQDILGKIAGGASVASLKIKAQALLFGKKLFSEEAIPYLVMFSVIIINLIIYQNVKKEIKKKENQSMIKTLNENISQKINLNDFKKKRRVLKF
jgi:spore germination protein YaaH